MFHNPCVVQFSREAKDCFETVIFQPEIQVVVDTNLQPLKAFVAQLGDRMSFHGLYELFRKMDRHMSLLEFQGCWGRSLYPRTSEKEHRLQTVRCDLP